MLFSDVSIVPLIIIYLVLECPSLVIITLTNSNIVSHQLPTERVFLATKLLGLPVCLHDPRWK